MPLDGADTHGCVVWYGEVLGLVVMLLFWPTLFTEDVLTKQRNRVGNRTLSGGKGLPSCENCLRRKTQITVSVQCDRRTVSGLFASTRPLLSSHFDL